VRVPTYETIFITPPDLAENVEKDTVETMAQIVTTGGGSMVFNDRMGRRRLAYPIQKFEDGIYIRFLYDSEADVPRELERRFRLSDNVLRHLTVRLEAEWAEQAKQDAVREAKRREEAALAAAQEAEQARLAAEQAKAEAAEAEAADAIDPATDDAAATAAAPAGEEPAAESVTPEQDSGEADEEAPAETKE
jgi:small subunit ribosomal protein S6